MSRRTNARPHRGNEGPGRAPQTLSGYLAAQPAPGVAAAPSGGIPPLRAPDMYSDPAVVQLFRDFPPSPVAAAPVAAAPGGPAVPDRFAPLIDGPAVGHIVDRWQEQIMESNGLAKDLFEEAVSALVARGVLRDIGQGGPATHSFLFCPFIWAVLQTSNPDVPAAWLNYGGQNDPRTVVAGHTQQEIYASGEWRNAIAQAVFAGAADDFTREYVDVIALDDEDEGPASGDRPVVPSTRPTSSTAQPDFLPSQRIFGSSETWGTVRRFALSTRSLRPYRGPACLAVHEASSASQLDQFFNGMRVVASSPGVAELLRSVVNDGFNGNGENAFQTVVQTLLRDEPPGQAIVPTYFGDDQTRSQIASILSDRMMHDSVNGAFYSARVGDFFAWIVALMDRDFTDGIDRTDVARRIVNTWAFNALTAYTQELSSGELDPVALRAAFRPPYPGLACAKGVMEGMGFAILRSIPIADDPSEAPGINRPTLLDRWFSASLTAQARNPDGLTPAQWATDLDRNIRALPAPNNNPADSQWTSAIATFNNSQNVRDTFAGGARRRAAAKRRRRTNRRRRHTGRKLTRSKKV